MKLHTFGDSFVAGDQDDDSDIEHLKYNVSFVSHIAQSLGLELKNYAEKGSGNFPQIDKLWQNLNNGNISSDDIVLFGLTSAARDRSFMLHLTNYLPISERVVHRSLLSGPPNDLINLDNFYILSVLDQFSKKFNIKIIKIMLWDNFLDYAPAKELFYCDDLVGQDSAGNTLIDVLNDTWGTNTSRSRKHDQLTIPEGYKHLYTKHKHPSIEGHIKIATWCLQNINFVKDE
jgi:hypothetical protein